MAIFLTGESSQRCCSALQFGMCRVVIAKQKRIVSLFGIGTETRLQQSRETSSRSRFKQCAYIGPILANGERISIELAFV